MNLQRQTAQNSPHSRRTSWVWSTKSNERNDRLYGRRTGSLRAKPGIHTDTESTRARCTATPRGLRRLHRAADLRAFPDRQGFFPSLAFLEQTQVRRSPHLDKSGQHAAHALQKPRHEARPRRSLRANFRVSGSSQCRGRRRGGAAAPAVVPEGGAQPAGHGHAAARGTESAGREAVPRRGPSARSHGPDFGLGARPPEAANPAPARRRQRPPMGRPSPPLAARTPTHTIPEPGGGEGEWRGSGRSSPSAAPHPKARRTPKWLNKGNLAQPPPPLRLAGGGGLGAGRGARGRAGAIPGGNPGNGGLPAAAAGGGMETAAKWPPGRAQALRAAAPRAQAGRQARRPEAVCSQSPHPSRPPPAHIARPDGAVCTHAPGLARRRFVSATRGTQPCFP